MGAFTLGQGGGQGAYTLGQDLSAKHLTRWLEEDSEKAWQKIYQATNICNHPPVGLPVTRQSDNPSWAVPFHHSANLFNMPQTGMFRMEDGTLQVPKWSCTLSGDLLAPELETADEEANIPRIATPWLDNETRMMHLRFPRADSLCLNFRRTAVFQWNAPNSSTLRRTTACFLLAFYAELSQSFTRVWPVILTSLRFLVGPGQDAGASKDKRASAARPRSYTKQTLQKIFSEPHLRRVRVVL